jgi:hypothetical protein
MLRLITNYVYLPDLQNLPNVSFYIQVFPICDKNLKDPEDPLFQIFLRAFTPDHSNIASADYFGTEEDIKDYLTHNFPNEVIDHDDTVGKIFTE